MPKKSVLLNIDDETLRDQVKFALEALFNLKTTSLSGVSSILNTLDQSQFAAVISTKSSRPDGLEKISEHFYCDKEQGIRALIIECYQKLTSFYNDSSEYIAYPINRFSFLVTQLGHHPEVYLQLSSERFVKVHSGRDEFEFARIEDYRDRGVSTIYIKRSDFFSYLDRHFNQLGEELKKLREAPVKNQQENILTVHFNLLRNSRDSLRVGLKIPDYILEQASNLIGNLIQNGAFEKPWLLRISKHLDSKHYVERLAVTTAQFACWVFTHSPYSEKKWLEKVVMASLIMDLGLADEATASVRELKLTVNASVMIQGVLVKGHPQRGLKLAGKLMHVHHDVDQLVLNHHERFDGSGFPKKLFFNQLTPVCRFFNLAHMFADRWMANESEADFKAYLDILIEDQRLKGIRELLVKLKNSLGQSATSGPLLCE